MVREDTYDLAPDPQDVPPPLPAATVGPPRPSGVVAEGWVKGAGVQGELLQLRDGVRLPDRCVFCNGTHHLYRVSRRLSWMESDNHNAGMGLLPVIGVIYKLIWLVGLIGRLQNRQHIQVDYAVCGRHRMLKTAGLIGVCLLLPLAALLFVMGFVWQSDGAKVVAGVLFVIALFAAAAARHALVVAEVGRNGFLVQGANKAFLQSLKDQNSVRLSR